MRQQYKKRYHSTFCCQFLLLKNPGAAPYQQSADYPGLRTCADSRLCPHDQGFTASDLPPKQGTCSTPSRGRRRIRNLQTGRLALTSQARRTGSAAGKGQPSLRMSFGVDNFDPLIRTIAYRMQELAYGGLSKATTRKLLISAKELETNGRLSQRGCPSPPRPAPALLLTRPTVVLRVDGRPPAPVAVIAAAIAWNQARRLGVVRGRGP
jgi:hypothetical protein